MTIPTALTIAGSDSGGGAGIQADLKTFTALRVYGASVITAITAQNTLGVHGVETLSVEIVRGQLRAVLGDLAPRAAKTGMLATPEIIEAVVEELGAARFTEVVVDPVMVAKHGHRLLEARAEEAMRRRLVPAAALVTPNIPEAEVLTGRRVESVDDMREAARALVGMGARAALVKGGHRAAPDITDVFFDGATLREFTDPRLDTPHTHGTGCTLSAAIAAFRALGHPLEEAVARARQYLRTAMERAFAVGGGIGPVNHLWPIPEPSDARH